MPTTGSTPSPAPPFPHRLALCRIVRHQQPYSDRESTLLAHRIEDACNDLLECLAASLGEDYQLVSLAVTPQKGSGNQHGQLITAVGVRGLISGFAHPEKPEWMPCGTGAGEACSR